MTSQRRILIATDFSNGSDEALDRAIDLAKQTAAELEIVHVLELGLGEFPFGVTSYGADRGGVIAYIDLALSERADRATKAGVPCRTKMLEGNAADEILAHARVIDASLVVVGTHGRTGLAHALLGSVAERIVRKSLCPVLTIPFSKKAA